MGHPSMAVQFGRSENSTLTDCFLLHAPPTLEHPLQPELPVASLHNFSKNSGSCQMGFEGSGLQHLH